MNTITMPGFSAEASLYRPRGHHQASALPASPRQGSQVLVHPALRPRPIFYRSMKGFCFDFRDAGGTRFCCNGDECGPDVLI